MGKTFSGKNKNKGYQIKKKDIEKQKQEEQARKGRKSNKRNKEEIPVIDPDGIKKLNELLKKENNITKEDEEKEM